MVLKKMLNKEQIEILEMFKGFEQTDHWKNKWEKFRLRHLRLLKLSEKIKKLR